MNRSIPVSTGLFAAIWANRREGEDTEDAILRRLVPGASNIDPAPSAPPAVEGTGVYDARNNVRFPEGFEIFRSYKRSNFTAVAQSGFWVRKDDGQRFSTLNQLNASIAAGSENVWNGNWKYRSSDGKVRSINGLRHV